MERLIEAINNLGMHCQTINHLGKPLLYITSFSRDVPIVLCGTGLSRIMSLEHTLITEDVLCTYGVLMTHLPELSALDTYVDYRSINMRHYSKLQKNVQYATRYDLPTDTTTAEASILGEHALIEQRWSGRLTEAAFATMEQLTENHLYTLESYRMYRNVLTIDRLLLDNAAYLEARKDGLPCDDVVKLMANGATVHSCLGDTLVCLSNTDAKFGVAIRASENVHKVTHVIVPMQLYYELKLVLSMYCERVLPVRYE